MPEVRSKEIGEKQYKDSKRGLRNLLPVIFILPLLIGGFVWLVLNMSNIKETIRTQGQEQLTPQQQAVLEYERYKEALASQRWFLCDTYSKIDCIDGGVNIVNFEPLTFKYMFRGGNSVESRVATYISTDCPGTWTIPTDSGYFCLEKQSDELYLGWINRNGYTDPFCLAYGRDSRYQEFDDAPTDCIKYFTDVASGKTTLSSIHNVH